MDLLINLDRGGKTSLYIQLYKQIKKAIIENRLKANSKLPAIREMADQLDINPATVVKAYNLLEREQLIYKRVGSGSYVSGNYVGSSGKRINLDRVSSEVADEPDLLEYGQIQVDSDINFASATPTPDLFPVKDFKRMINRVLDRDGGEAFVYQKSQGYYPLRESIQAQLNKQGIEVDIDNIQIVSGAQQAIDLIAKILVDFEDTVLVEEPTYSGALSAFQSRGARIKSIPLLSNGLDLNKLEEVLPDIDVSFIYVMTSFQNPTGISWSREAKEGLLKLAGKYNFLIIEDDCLSDLYYQGERPVPLKAYDRDDRVIYIKSYSKIFMPGLRLAFMILPKNLIPSILAAKYATDISSSGLTQRAFDLYLREGLWDRHLEKMRQLFKKRFQMMKIMMKSFPSEVSLIFEPQGGLYFWLSLPEDVDSESFYRMALKNGVAFLPGRVFSVKEGNLPLFRLSFAAVDEPEIKRGMDLLARLLREFIEKGNRREGYLPLL
ncbi:MAG: 2-aminoadipate transaminase [Halanaerobiales bacterium]|nr:2-aminoadipate transaminase [Halanaerobiales bacterium]